VARIAELIGWQGGVHTPSAVGSPLRQHAFWWCGISAALFAANLIGFHLLMIPSAPRMAVIWPANALLLAVFLATSPSRWIGLAAAALVARLAIVFSTPLPVDATLAAAVGNLAQPLVAAMCLRCWGAPRTLFRTLAGITAFVAFAAVAAPVIGSVLSGIALWSVGAITDVAQHVRIRFVTNALGTLALGPPFILLMLRPGPLARLRLANVGELALLLGSLAAVEQLVPEVSEGGLDTSLLYLPLPFLLWAAVRYGTVGVALALLLITLLRFNGEALESNGLALLPDRLAQVQLVLIAMSLPFFFLAALYRERRDVEQALRVEHQRYGLATSAGGVGVWDWNLDTSDIYVDPALKRLLGYEDHEIRNRLDDWGRHVHPDDVPQVMSESVDHIEGRTPSYEVEHRMVHRDGSTRWFVAKGVVVERVNGRAVRMIGTDTDITQRKAAEQALERAQNELARATRLSEMGELAASIAHEVNQPLCAIVANAAAAQRYLNHDSLDFGQIRAALEDVARDGKRASEVIRRTRGLFERRRIDAVPIQINGIIIDAIALTRSAADSANVRVRTDLQAEMPFVKGDSVQLQQVFFNLLANAVTAMSGGTNGSGILTIASTSDDRTILVTVRDTGAGIPFSDPEEIFRPLVTTKPDGLGMGLPMSRSIIEAHDGHLWASKNEGPGTTFHVALPVS
jgi:PAS domain S-box-containing protein